MRPKVVLIGTGGTIASRFDPQLGRTVASQRGEDLLAQVPQLAEIAEIEVDDFATVPSFDMAADPPSGSRGGSTSSWRAPTSRAWW